MKLISIFRSTFFLLLFLSCSKGGEKEVPMKVHSVINTIEIPVKEVNISELHYDTKTSQWTLANDLFSGYAVRYYKDSILQERFGIVDGKKQNESISWFRDGHYQHFSNYHKGKLHGDKKSWTADSTHILVSHLNYYLGKGHGIQKKWYASGEIFKILNLEMGKEEGIQQAFRKNGDLFANYEAKEGRIFGLKKSALCFGLDNEKIQYEN